MKKRINKRGLSLKEIRNFLTIETIKTSKFDYSLLKMWIMEKLGLWEFKVLIEQDRELHPSQKKINLIMLIEKNRKLKELYINHYFININLLDAESTDDYNMIRFEIPAYMNNVFLSYARENFQSALLYCNKSEKRIKKYLGIYLNFLYNHYLSIKNNKYVLYKEINPEKLKPLLLEIN